MAKVPSFRIATLHAYEALKNKKEGYVYPARVRITPKEAKNIFDNLNYDRNRRFDERRAESIAFAMIEGDVEETESIVFCVLASQLILVDGQHRMWSVTQLEEDWEFTVNFKKVNSMEEVGKTYAAQDLGSTRSTTDGAKAQHLDDKIGISRALFPKALAAAKLINIGFQNTTSNEVIRIYRSNRRANETALAYKTELRLLDAIQKKGVPNVKRLFLNAPTIAAAVLMLRHQPKAATEFWTRIVQDDGLKQGDPCKALLDFFRLMKEKDITLRGQERSLYVSMAWNAFYADRKMTRLKRKDTLPPARGIVLKGTPWDGDKLEP